MENYNHIYYGDCPHFALPGADQWGEDGFLFYEGMVYEYFEDRKENYGKTHKPRTIKDFLRYASEQRIEIPESFGEVIKGLE